MRFIQKMFFDTLIRATAVVCFFIFFIGCSKEELLSGNGHVRYTGSFASGGCEWIIELPEGKYEPHNLPAAFQTDGLNVDITYRVLQATANCPHALNYKGVIHLNRIN